MGRQHPYELNRSHRVVVRGGSLGSGVNLSLTPTTRNWAEFLSVTVTLETDANAADRRMVLVMGSIASDDLRIVSPTVQTASKIWSYHFFQGAGQLLDASADNFICLPLPSNIRWQSPDNIRTEMINLQATDHIVNSSIIINYWTDPIVVT